MDITLRRLLELFLVICTIVFYFFAVQVRGMPDMGILATLLQNLPLYLIATIMIGSIDIILTLNQPVHLMEFIRTGSLLFLIICLVAQMFHFARLGMTGFIAHATTVISISIGLVFKKE